ncbi:hypothetical protein AD934_02335 [Gluconobacter oxydans]|uniref:Uncharacterized protein n=2 Tax=Gluconobacter oxydans TaxID=442 RepID=A0A149S3Z6_GLUOY|nr:hypothetical protein AD934_02335 [Gluconobacter oxydans]
MLSVLNASFADSSKGIVASMLPVGKTDIVPFSRQHVWSHRSPEETRQLAVTMARQGVNIAYMAAALFVSRFELDAIAREEGLTLNRAPLRANARAWSLLDVGRLSRAWTAGETLSEIATRLGRTRDAVRKKRASLGLPARQGPAEAEWTAADVTTLMEHRSRKVGLRRLSKILNRSVGSLQRKLITMGLLADPQAIPSDPSVVLTWEQASRLTPHQRRGRSWQVRNSPTGLVVGFSRKACTTRWSVEMQHELAMRHFAHQSPDSVAEDFLLSKRTIVSQSGWLHLPRRAKKNLREGFDPSLSEVYITKMDYIRRECLGKRGFFFWSPRRGGRFTSRLHQQSAVMRSGD